jgi:hypothetical protein
MWLIRLLHPTSSKNGLPGVPVQIINVCGILIEDEVLGILVLSHHADFKPNYCGTTMFCAPKWLYRNGNRRKHPQS